MTKGSPHPAAIAEYDRSTSALPSHSVPAHDEIKRSSRTGAVQIAAHFPEDVRAQLKMIAAEQRRDVQDLLAEGLNLIFSKYGKPEIAPLRRGR